ncbi:DUF3102 domain-containing protein [Gracilibacillus timonensis]|uniref:DUF3102 domain-containing protein n=1 Tax=Gracilibacillus timonensis TaxID=1816696 RepID=UPI000825FF15|nr:DUF3102 domain-containing protein [Gracilibacillus timonensis]
MTEIAEQERKQELSTDLNVITTEITTYKRIAGEAIFEIGRRLKHVKESDLAHGEFGKWLEEVEIDRSVSAKFIKVYEELKQDDVSTYTHFGLNALHLIATLPESERTATHTTAKGEEKTPDEMTVKELRELKRQLKAETQAKEKAEQQAESAQDRERLANAKAEKLEQKEPEVRTEYVYIEKRAQLNTPSFVYKEKSSFSSTILYRSSIVSFEYFK